MTHAVFGYSDGELSLTVSDPIEPCDMVMLCYMNHQRQPARMVPIDAITEDDILYAVNGGWRKEHGDEFDVVPFNSKNHVFVGRGSANQGERVGQAFQDMMVYRLPDCHPLKAHDKKTLDTVRNCVFVIGELPDGTMLPFGNQLTHQWYDDSEKHYFEYAPNLIGFHFYLFSSRDSVHFRHFKYWLNEIRDQPSLHSLPNLEISYYAA